MQRPLRVCFVSHATGTGGAERVLYTLVAGLVREHGVACTVFVPDDEGPLVPLLRAAGASVVRVAYAAWCRPAESAAASDARWATSAGAVFAELLPALERADPHVVITNTITIPWGALAASALGRPHVWYVQERGEPYLAFELPFMTVRDAIVDASNLVFLGSHYVRDELFADLPAERVAARHGRRGVRMICPVEAPAAATARAVDASLYRRPGATKLVAVGPIIELKGQEDAVRAVGELVRRGVDVELALVGYHTRPPFLERLRRIAGELGVADRIAFAGCVADPDAVRRQADIALACSRHEAVGLGTVEAMMLGMPVIGARSGETPRLLGGGARGLLYEPGDAGGLADAVAALVADPERARALAAAGREHARAEFDAARNVSMAYEALAELAGQGNPASSPWLAATYQMFSQAQRDNRDIAPSIGWRTYRRLLKQVRALLSEGARLGALYRSFWHRFP